MYKRKETSKDNDKVIYKNIQPLIRILSIMHSDKFTVKKVNIGKSH